MLQALAFQSPSVYCCVLRWHCCLCCSCRRQVIEEIKSTYKEGRALLFDEHQVRYEKGTILQLRERPGSVNKQEESVNALKDIWLLSQGDAFIGTRSSFFGRTGFFLMFVCGERGGKERGKREGGWLGGWPGGREGKRKEEGGGRWNEGRREEGEGRKGGREEGVGVAGLRDGRRERCDPGLCRPANVVPACPPSRYASGRMQAYRLLDSDPWGQFPAGNTLCF